MHKKYHKSTAQYIIIRESPLTSLTMGYKMTKGYKMNMGNKIIMGYNPWFHEL